MIVRTFQNKRTTDLPYDMKVIHCYCPFKMHFFEKIIVFIVLSFIADILCAQDIWTKEDSVKLSKILNSETPISINSDFKRELEKSSIGEPIRESYGSWNDFILDVKTYDFDISKYQSINMGHIFNKPTSVKFFNLNNEYLKHNKFTIDGRIDVDNPLIYLQRNTKLTFPLDRKLHFNISVSYALDKSHSPILPINPTPYSWGAGFSYDIGKDIAIGSQANYQYNIIQKKWEWFWVLKISIIF